MAREFLNTHISVDGSEMAELAKAALGTNAAAQAEHAKNFYEQKVLEVLDNIRKAQTGRAVFTAISRQGPHFDITIKPYFIDPDLEFEINKSKASLQNYPGTLEDYHKSRIKQLEQEALKRPPGATASKAGRPVGVPDQLGRKNKRQTALVRFTPANWTYNSINVELGLGTGSPFVEVGSSPDEVLLHELVHALRFTAGINNKKRKVAFQERYDNWEDWIAILIANIYHSERGLKHRRLDHRSFDFGEAINETFLKEGLNRMHIRQFRRQQPLLFNDLNDVKASFNPLRGFSDAWI